MKPIYELLDFSAQEKQILSLTDDGLTNEERLEFSKTLTDPNLYKTAFNRLIARLLSDDDGLKMLSLMLFSAKTSLQKYQAYGIPENIFIDTFNCFSRFTKEYKKQYGKFGFDRGFWTGRQLSLTLFRIGELEYELSRSLNGEREVALHVPSDCDLSSDKIDLSIENAKSFIKKFYPDYAQAPYYITSWLNSPLLKEVLDDSSKILAFQTRFTVISERPSDEYKFWVYGFPNLNPEDFSENTSLQRRLKSLILSGRVMTEATAKLKV